VTDDERIIEAIAMAEYETETGCSAVTWDQFDGRDIWRVDAKTTLNKLRAAGVTITPPPLPEPTYTVTLSQQDRFNVMRALNASRSLLFDHGDRMNADESWRIFSELQPDSVTS
jgi:hypothetical protein